MISDWDARTFMRSSPLRVSTWAIGGLPPALASCLAGESLAESYCGGYPEGASLSAAPEAFSALRLSREATGSAAAPVGALDGGCRVTGIGVRATVVRYGS